MLKLVDSLRDWQTTAFKQTLKREVENLPGDTLPLHLCTTEGGKVDDGNLSVTIHRAEETKGSIEVRLGVFFTEIVGGCNCADDPLEKNAYAELLLRLDTVTAEGSFEVVDT